MLKLVWCLATFFSSIILFLILISIKVIDLSSLQTLDDEVLKNVSARIRHYGR